VHPQVRPLPRALGHPTRAALCCASGGDGALGASAARNLVHTTSRIKALSWGMAAANHVDVTHGPANRSRRSTRGCGSSCACVEVMCRTRLSAMAWRSQLRHRARHGQPFPVPGDRAAARVRQHLRSARAVRQRLNHLPPLSPRFPNLRRGARRSAAHVSLPPTIPPGLVRSRRW
jgi:hypothetical protein